MSELEPIHLEWIHRRVGRIKPVHPDLDVWGGLVEKIGEKSFRFQILLSWPSAGQSPDQAARV